MRRDNPVAAQPPLFDADGITRMPTSADVIELAHRDPVVAHCVTLWRRGEVTWDQCLMVCVTCLARQNQGLVRANVDLLMRQAPGGAKT